MLVLMHTEWLCILACVRAGVHVCVVFVMNVRACVSACVHAEVRTGARFGEWLESLVHGGFLGGISLILSTRSERSIRTFSTKNQWSKNLQPKGRNGRADRTFMLWWQICSSAAVASPGGA